MSESTRISALKRVLDHQFPEIVSLGYPEGRHQLEGHSTGLPGLDRILGGSLIKGRFCELYGPPSTAKTSLALTVIGHFQQQGLSCAFIDAEHALFGASHLTTLGVDKDKLLIGQPDDAEQYYEIVHVLCQSGALDLVVMDSFASLMSRKEIESDSPQVAAVASLASAFVKRTTPVIKRNGTSVIALNQIRQKIEFGRSAGETTPGGDALKYHSTARLRTSFAKRIKDKAGDVVGIVLKVTAVKNKAAAPYRSCYLHLHFDSGIDRMASLAETLLIYDTSHDLGLPYDTEKELTMWLKSEPEQAEELAQQLIGDE